MQENSLSLSQLNMQVRNAIRNNLPETFWLRAETSDVRENQNGHCYLEFIEKDQRNNTIIAKSRAIIWSNTFALLSAYFTAETGQKFVSGLNVLVCVSVEFHELHGFSLKVVDIDPLFTIGEIARNRQIIIQQLEDEGVLTLNKELVLPELSNRIAVISSPTAAGYEDFCNQLANNNNGFVFYTKLFPAIMQGERAENSVIEALDKIYSVKDNFDAVAIIRGGGSSSDLSCFDSYIIANNCAQFPLPIISGIGHERDVSVVDYVANTRSKTPTAVAEFLINRTLQTATHLQKLQRKLIDLSSQKIQMEQKLMSDLSKNIVYYTNFFVNKQYSFLQQMAINLKHDTKKLLQNELYFISEKKQYIKMVSPENILKRGYTLTLQNGKIVKSVEQINDNETIETHFAHGSISSKIISKKRQFN